MRVIQCHRERETGIEREREGESVEGTEGEREGEREKERESQRKRVSGRDRK